MNREIAEPKSPVLSDSLVTGFVDAQGALHTAFVVRELTGAEEDILAGKGPVVQRLNQIIVNCTVSLGELTERSAIRSAVEQLSATDRMVMLIAIRRASFGDIYFMRIKCPADKCQKVSDASVDLASLERQSAPDPTKTTFEDRLPSGKLVRWHVMRGSDESWLMETRKKLKDESDLTLALLTRVDVIGDTVLNRQTALQSAIDCARKLSSSDRGALRNRFLANEGKLDTMIEYQCPHCGHELTAPLDVAQSGFFFPQETLPG